MLHTVCKSVTYRKSCETYRKVIDKCTVCYRSFMFIFVITLSKKIRMHSESELFHFTLTIARAKRTQAVPSDCSMFIYIYNKQLAISCEAHFFRLDDFHSRSHSMSFEGQVKIHILRIILSAQHSFPFLIKYWFCIFVKVNFVFERPFTKIIFWLLCHSDLLSVSKFIAKTFSLKLFVDKFWNKPYELFESYS